MLLTLESDFSDPSMPKYKKMHLGRVNKKRNYISVIPFMKMEGLNSTIFIIVVVKN
tara:strand:- start:51 stop:218 length:168 start_codon:yes stop_codon:yes gene_type:complete